jgi:hypothetical protein
MNRQDAKNAEKLEIENRDSRIITSFDRGENMTSRLLKILAAWGLIVLILGTIARDEPVGRAVIAMTWGLILLWIVLGGALMLHYRDAIRACVLAIRLGWKLKFVLFATLLALIEEAVTTTMTNLAPLFGVKMGEAFITASPNYLEVILLHSVIVFVPMFIVWAWLLGRWDFRADQVLLLFGITGTLSESIAFGFQNFLLLGMWVFVYGLMVYLPAYSIPADRGARSPRWWHYPLALLLPIPFAMLMALLILIVNPAA